ncbi:MAG: penicillin-binding protein 1A [Saprospiraceae bacterium]|jgi:penicillin-binding protein 1A
MTKRITSKKKTKVPRNEFVKYIKILWAAILAGLLLVVCLFIFISKTQLPDTQELEQPNYEIATIIKADDGRELGKAFKLNRVWLQYEEINPLIVDALVATEDERYFDHCGIDARSFARAVAFLGTKGGASTITQQLAKLFFTQRSKSFIPRVWQKLKEWVIAIEFEKQYTKEEILAMYLNKYDYLYGANGIAAAAKTYFGKDQSELKIEEAALLVGMHKNPWIYNPIKFLENANKRRAVVMKQMVKNDKLDSQTYKKLNAEPIDVSGFKREGNYGGVAPYFRAELVKTVKNILEEDEYSKPDGTKYDLFTDGLVINTTIDLDMQRHAEAAANAHMSNLQETYFKRWKNKDPWSYGADARQKKIRQSNLLRQIRESDRFLKMRNSYIGKVSSEISAEIENVRLWDTDIFRLFAEDKKAGTMANMVKRKTIDRDQSKVYKKILASKHWPKLKSQWNKLQKAKDRVFKKKVKTTVFAYNSKSEKTVEMSPLDSIKYHNMHLQLGSISIDPKTGNIKTWVGGVGHNYFKFDHINSSRQVGSTFKPFVYATAIIERGTSPCQKVKDQQYVIAAHDPGFGNTKAWAPKNAGAFTGEYFTLKDGLRKSLNSVSVHLMKEIGNVEPVRQLASSLGIPKEKIPPYPSIALGTPELSVMEMAGAYTTFANDGVYTKPQYIKSIEDANGRVIYINNQSKKRAISSGYNYAMVDILKYAQGTAGVRAGLKSEFGGKTGTTNDHKNGWFMGITPDLVVATWVGGDNEWIRFLNLADGQGGVMARPFCTGFLSRIEADSNVDYDVNARFKIPEVLEVNMDCSVYAAMEEEDKKAAKLDLINKKKEDGELDEEF